MPRVPQAAFAAALSDPLGPPPAGLTTARGLADPKRFAVYRNNVLAGLIGVLEQRFPVVRRLVGDDFFRGMARAFVAARLPGTPVMSEYGDALPAFIAAFEPAASVPYLADVARLEAAWTRAYHAADAEPLDVAALSRVGADALAGLRLLRHPAASLLRSDWPVGSIWAAHQSADVRPVGHARRETVLVVRPDAGVAVHILPAADAAFAAALIQGEPLGTAAARAADADGHFDFGVALVGLIGLGAFAAMPDLRPR